MKKEIEREFLTYINGKGLEWISRADFFILLFPRILSRFLSYICFLAHIYRNLVTCLVD
jgi:hypothetical protein